MPRGKGKVMAKTLKDKNISDMFNQMIGTGDVNVNIVYPKYSEIARISMQLIKLLKTFNNGVLMKAIPDVVHARTEIATFIEMCEKEHAELFCFQDLSKYDGMFNMVPDDVRSEFSKLYEQSKESDMIKTFIIVCDKLVEYKKHISDPKNLSYKFINTMAGIEFSPLPFATLNFKYLFSMDSLDESARTYLLLILNKIYTYTYRLYHEFSKPDIDVNEFVNVIISNMDQVKKQIPRCGKAFRKITESVELLKDNFGGYYRDFVQTQNSSIIMEHFVLDVSKSTDADPETTQQFRRIINYYRKMTAGKIKDPRVSYLFDKVDASFGELDKFSNMKKDKNGEFDGDDADTESASASADTADADADAESVKGVAASPASANDNNPSDASETTQ